MRIIDSFFDLTISLCALTAEASLLTEDFSWSAATEKLHFKERKLLGSVHTYRKNIQAFQRQLKYYVENYRDLDDFDDDHTTNKFFTETVATMRSRAQKSVNNLVRCFAKYSNNEALLEAVNDLIAATNEYIDLCVYIVKFNPRLRRQRELLGVDKLIEKYDLYHIV